jgi:hypothetical protein
MELAMLERPPDTAYPSRPTVGLDAGPARLAGSHLDHLMEWSGCVPS